jgi:hypothetical protein
MCVLHGNNSLFKNTYFSYVTSDVTMHDDQNIAAPATSCSFSLVLVHDEWK